MYLVAAVFVLMAAALYQWCIIGLVVYIGFGTFLGLLRTGVRRKYQIQHGDIFTDLESLYVCMCMYTYVYIYIYIYIM